MPSDQDPDLQLSRALKALVQALLTASKSIQFLDDVILLKEEYGDHLENHWLLASFKCRVIASLLIKLFHDLQPKCPTIGPTMSRPPSFYFLFQT